MLGEGQDRRGIEQRELTSSRHPGLLLTALERLALQCNITAWLTPGGFVSASHRPFFYRSVWIVLYSIEDLPHYEWVLPALGIELL